jgi:16S rRNA (adenine1518-N6/adenine1519-N6)-dimethyltransferase
MQKQDKKEKKNPRKPGKKPSWLDSGLRADMSQSEDHSIPFDKVEEVEGELSPAELEQQLAALGGPMVFEEEEEPRLATKIGYYRKHGGLPATKKSLGQNWLHDQFVTRDMANSLLVGKGDLIVEVGPGGGALTEALLTTGADILGVEIDQRMVGILRKRWKDEPRFSVLHADILQSDIAEITDGRDFVIVGNLPYHITSSLLFNLMDHARHNPGTLKRIVVLLQYEVAKRIAAKPGSSEYSILSVFLRMWGNPEFLMKVDRRKFTPPPKVDAGVIRLDVSEKPLYPLPNWAVFKGLVKGTFGKRRKMLRNSMPGVPNIGNWEAIDFDWTRRPQTLSAEEYANLAQLLIPKKDRDGE